MIYTIFEDNTAKNLYPFTLNHAVVEIRYGAFTIIERFQNLLNDGDKIFLIVRDSVRDIVAEKYPNIPVNPETIPPSKYINSNQLLELTLEGTFIQEEVSLSDFKASSDNPAPQFMWDYLAKNRKILSEDKKKFSMSIEGDCDSSCIFVKENNVHISSSAKNLPIQLLLPKPNGKYARIFC